MDQRIDVADVAIGHLDAAIGQGAEYDRIEIDHADLLQQRRLVALDLTEQRARRAEKAKEHDRPSAAMAAVVAGLTVLARVEVAQTDPLQHRDATPRDRIGTHDDEG